LLAVGGPRELQRDGEAQIGNKRERVRRVDRQRRQHGKNVAEEMIFEPGPLLFGQLRTIDQRDALCRERSPQLAPALLLVVRQC
jgi:hypothetical protein